MVMSKRFWPILGLLVLLAVAGGRLAYTAKTPVSQPLSFKASASPILTKPAFSQVPVPAVAVPTISFVGPRQNIPKDAPADYGFWSFAVPVPGVLSRSGQPLLSEFTWLKQNGWKSDVDLRTDGERGEVGDDAKIKGFNQLGLNYLYLPIADGSPPTDAQAKQFLDFVANPANQPAHVHCRGGYGRAGTMVALYRHSAQGWPMEKAIEESRLFHGGVSSSQTKWLLDWAGRYPK